jgi:hypothetical protein
MKVSDILEGKNQTESLSILCKLFGSKIGTYDAKCLSTEALNIIIDGRIADEYEDLPEPAPCRVDYIAVNNDSNHLWFHMYTAFSTHYPLASNDRYNIGVMGADSIERVYDHYYSVYKDKKVDEKKLAEIRRSEWIKIAGRLSYIEMLGSDVRHLIDCTYCCHGSESGWGGGHKDPDGIISFKWHTDSDKYPKLQSYAKDTPGVTVDLKNSKIMVEEDVFIKLLLDSITPTVALGLRTTYPTYDKFKECGYLAYQGTGRYVRWKKITPLVYKRAKEQCDDDTLTKALLRSPSDVIVNGVFDKNLL